MKTWHKWVLVAVIVLQAAAMPFVAYYSYKMGVHAVLEYINSVRGI